MVWGKWMEPELSTTQEIALLSLERELRNTLKRNPEHLIQLCISLGRQSQMQQSIITKAAARITELETLLAIAPSAPQRRRWRFPGWRAFRR